MKSITRPRGSPDTNFWKSFKRPRVIQKCESTDFYSAETAWWISIQCAESLRLGRLSLIDFWTRHQVNVLHLHSGNSIAYSVFWNQLNLVIGYIASVMKFTLNSIERGGAEPLKISVVRNRKIVFVRLEVAWVRGCPRPILIQFELIR